MSRFIESQILDFFAVYFSLKTFLFELYFSIDLRKQAKTTVQTGDRFFTKRKLHRRNFIQFHSLTVIRFIPQRQHDRELD